MSERISEMTGGVELQAADWVPALRAGANVRVQVPMLETVSTSAGAASAGRLAVLNGLGQFDPSFISLGLLRCIYGLGANQPNCVSATPTKVLIDTLIEDNSGGLMFDAANHRIYFTRNGTYQVTPLCRFGAISANGPRIISFVFKNGNPGTFLHQAEGSGLAGGNPGFAIPSPDVYVAGDYIELHGYQTTGANQLIVGDGTTGNSFLAVVEAPR